jgi:hypothetical protein
MRVQGLNYGLGDVDCLIHLLERGARTGQDIGSSLLLQVLYNCLPWVSFTLAAQDYDRERQAANVAFSSSLR